ncbi:hypothetical protein C8J56DRAFT_1175830 [Mycena floridula]|nr:hypothetical protein C8J56DRAFT_1175830 [Mycena floridula]
MMSTSIEFDAPALESSIKFPRDLITDGKSSAITSETLMFNRWLYPRCSNVWLSTPCSSRDELREIGVVAGIPRLLTRALRGIQPLDPKPALQLYTSIHNEPVGEARLPELLEKPGPMALTVTMIDIDRGMRLYNSIRFLSVPGIRENPTRQSPTETQITSNKEAHHIAYNVKQQITAFNLADSPRCRLQLQYRHS